MLLLKTVPGAVLSKPIRNAGEIPAYSGAKCIDTTGAGDTFTACFLHALGKNFSLPDCGRFANAGASICIENLGACGAGNDINVILKRAGLEE